MKLSKTINVFGKQALLTVDWTRIGWIEYVSWNISNMDEDRFWLVIQKTEQRGMLEDFNKKGLSEFLEAVYGFFRISLNCFS